MNSTLACVRLESIIVDARARQDSGNLDELMDSIQRLGLIGPLAVENQPDGLHLIAGGRRYNACRLLEMEEVPVCIYSELTPLQKKEIELEENLRRLDLTWQEAASLTEQIHNLKLHQSAAAGASMDNWRQMDTADLLHTSAGQVNQLLNLAKAMKDDPEVAKQRNISDAMKVVRRKAEAKVREAMSQTFMSKDPKTELELARHYLIDRYVVSDALVGTRSLASSCADLVEIDPPYAVDLVNLKSQPKYNSAGVSSEYTDVTTDEFMALMDKVLSEAWRILKVNRWLIVWCPIRSLELVTELIQSKGFTIGVVPAIWVKPGGQASTLHPMTKLGNSYEAFLYARKGDAKLIKEGRSNVFSFVRSPVLEITHPAEKPIDLMQEIYSTFCLPRQTIIIPFLGSGTGILAANSLIMDAIGFDNSQQHKDNFITRVAQFPARNLRR